MYAKANASKSCGQQEKEDELRRVPREDSLRLQPTLNVYFSWTLAGPAASTIKSNIFEVIGDLVHDFMNFIIICIKNYLKKIIKK